MATVHAHIVVVVCEIGEAATLKAAEERIIRTQRQREDPSLPVLLVCNKIDKPQSGEQNEKAVNDLAARKNVELFWTSAKNKFGIPQLLQRLVELAPEAQTNRKCCNLI
jgi:50S ribosomal subunit-associated GTPase HflX